MYSFWKAARPVRKSTVWGCGFATCAGLDGSDEHPLIISSKSTATGNFFISTFLVLVKLGNRKSRSYSTRQINQRDHAFLPETFARGNCLRYQRHGCRGVDPPAREQM